MCIRQKMAHPASTLNDELTCLVCYQHCKNPRSLPCHHSFCKECFEPVSALEQSGEEQLYEAVEASRYEAVPDQQATGATEITCPCCCNVFVLPRGGVSELPTESLFNNLLEMQQSGAAEYDLVTQKSTSQIASKLLCDKHERVVEFYCKDCGDLVCSVCAIKKPSYT